jgi:hypothetical protein
MKLRTLALVPIAGLVVGGFAALPEGAAAARAREQACASEDSKTVRSTALVRVYTKPRFVDGRRRRVLYACARRTGAKRRLGPLSGFSGTSLVSARALWIFGEDVLYHRWRDFTVKQYDVGMTLIRLDVRTGRLKFEYGSEARHDVLYPPVFAKTAVLPPDTFAFWAEHFGRYNLVVHDRKGLRVVESGHDGSAPAWLVLGRGGDNVVYDWFGQLKRFRFE